MKLRRRKPSTSKEQHASGVIGWDSFEPTFSRVETLNYPDLWNLAAEVLEEWYQYDAEALSRLVKILHKRLLQVSF
jgi:hypothetical protein